MATRRFHKKGKKGNRRTKTQKNHKKAHTVVFGKIYATWCGHCRAMEEDWKRLEKKMRPLQCVNIESEEKDHKIAAFNKKYKTDLELKGGFPTLFRLKNHGAPVDYYKGGDRSEAALHNWLLSSYEEHSANNSGNEPMQHHKPKGNNNSFLANLF